jgi:hypothetical protein
VFGLWLLSHDLLAGKFLGKKRRRRVIGMFDLSTGCLTGINHAHNDSYEGCQKQPDYIDVALCLSGHGVNGKYNDECSTGRVLDNCEDCNGELE